ncbi:hypothetical protein VN97_g8726 [Penicillium thymicola]|uniref:Uncharacterized protein n=1 Tax=Penicillium thymicola TaxID=293382 RepID=A0AAI9TC83_PENTH|nr:hypothetical protein VN97_g8726 [Penicillium thymicola]
MGSVSSLYGLQKPKLEGNKLRTRISSLWRNYSLRLDAKKCGQGCARQIDQVMRMKEDLARLIGFSFCLICLHDGFPRFLQEITVL